MIQNLVVHGRCSRPFGPARQPPPFDPLPRGEDRPTPSSVGHLDPLFSPSPRLTLHFHRNSRWSKAKMLQSQKMILAGVFRRNRQPFGASGQNVVQVRTKSPPERPRGGSGTAGGPPASSSGCCPPGTPETVVQLKHLLEVPQERPDRPATSPVQRPPEPPLSGF